MSALQQTLRRIAAAIAAFDADGRAASRSYRLARRIAVAGIGATLLLIGLAMTVLPGPAMVVIPMGLAVLGLEFAWARRWLAQVREHGSRALESIFRRGRGPNGADAAPGRDPGQPAGPSRVSAIAHTELETAASRRDPGGSA